MAYRDPITEVRRRLNIGQGFAVGMEAAVNAIANSVERSKAGKAQSEAEKRQTELWLKRLDLENKNRAEIERQLFEYRKKLSGQDFKQDVYKMLLSAMGQKDLEALKQRGIKPDYAEAKINDVTEYANTWYDSIDDDKYKERLNTEFGIKKGSDLFSKKIALEKSAEPEKLTELNNIRSDVSRDYLINIRTKIRNAGGITNIKPNYREDLLNIAADSVAKVLDFTDLGIDRAFADWNQSDLTYISAFINESIIKRPELKPKWKNFQELVGSGITATASELERTFQYQAGLENAGVVQGMFGEYTPMAEVSQTDDSRLGYNAPKVEPLGAVGTAVSRVVSPKIRWSDPSRASFWGELVSDTSKASAIKVFEEGNKTDPLYNVGEQLFNERKSDFTKKNIQYAKDFLAYYKNQSREKYKKDVPINPDDLKSILKQKNTPFEYFTPEAQQELLINFSIPQQFQTGY